MLGQLGQNEKRIPTVVVAQSFLNRLLFVSTTVALLTAFGYGHYQSLATISDEDQLDASARDFAAS